MRQSLSHLNLSLKKLIEAREPNERTAKQKYLDTALNTLREKLAGGLAQEEKGWFWNYVDDELPF
jgi:hypothetical protein